eukprot:1002661_1
MFASSFLLICMVGLTSAAKNHFLEEKAHDVLHELSFMFRGTSRRTEINATCVSENEVLLSNDEVYDALFSFVETKCLFEKYDDMGFVTCDNTTEIDDAYMACEAAGGQNVVINGAILCFDEVSGYEFFFYDLPECIG